MTSGGLSSIESVAQDGINLVTFSDTPTNRAAVGSARARTLLWADSNNNIIEVDIVFSPDIAFSTDQTPGTRDLGSVAAHEFGHAIGLHHSGALTATLYTISENNGGITEDAILRRTMNADDRAGMRALYPSKTVADGLFGGLTGAVLLNWEPVYGAQVVAVHQESGIVYGTNLTLGSNQGARFGEFEVFGLPPGDYLVYADLLNGPVTELSWVGDFNAGDHWGGNFTQNYLMTYYGGNASPLTVHIDSGSLTDITINVEPGTPTLNPVRAAFSETGTGWPSSTFTTLNFQPGTTRHIVLLGDGLNLVANSDISSSDPRIMIDTSARLSGVLGSGLPYTLFQISVPSDATPGARDLYFRIGDEVGVYTGGLNVDGEERLFPPSDLVWVDFARLSAGAGTFEQPYPSLTEGLDAVFGGGTIRIFAGDSVDTMTLEKPVRIEAVSGSVRIGVSE